MTAEEITNLMDGEEVKYTDVIRDLASEIVEIKRQVSLLYLSASCIDPLMGAIQSQLDCLAKKNGLKFNE